MDDFYHILALTNTQKWVGRVESQLHHLSHQSTMAYTAKKEASIVLSHTAALSEVVPVCSASQGQERELVFVAAPLIAPSSLTLPFLSLGPISHYDTVNPQFLSKATSRLSAAH